MWPQLDPTRALGVTGATGLSCPQASGGHFCAHMSQRLPFPWVGRSLAQCPFLGEGDIQELLAANIGDSWPRKGGPDGGPRGSTAHIIEGIALFKWS